jgi:hypothetical protein
LITITLLVSFSISLLLLLDLAFSSYDITYGIDSIITRAIKESKSLSHMNKSNKLSKRIVNRYKLLNK